MVRLQEETQAGMYDLILHVGDFAYDLDTVHLHTMYNDVIFDNLRSIVLKKDKEK